MKRAEDDLGGPSIEPTSAVGGGGAPPRADRAEAGPPPGADRAEAGPPPRVGGGPPAWVAAAASALSETVQALGRRLVPAPAGLLMTTVGYEIISRSITAAAELGVADQLAGGALSVEELAAALGADVEALRRLLRLLESAGIVRTRRSGKVALTRLGAPLRGDHAQSLRDWCRYLGADWHWELWADLDDAVRDGRTAYERRFNTDFWNWFEQHPGSARVFDAAMRSFSSVVDPAIASVCELGEARTLVDIAGGTGGFLATLLRAHATLRGTLFDQPDVIARAGEPGGPLAAPDIGERVVLEAGDMFAGIPEGHDAYILKWILHDWDDAHASRILERVGAACRPGARVLIADMLIADGRGARAALQLDMAMLVLTGGRERTADEFRQLLAEAGFELRQVRRTASPFSVLDATRIG